MYGAALLEEVLTEVNATERVGASPVRLALEAKLRAQGRTVPRPVELPDRRLRDVVVERTDLSPASLRSELLPGDHDARYGH